ncbi:NfeD family protein [Arcanobacterium hippocoleae]
MAWGIWALIAIVLLILETITVDFSLLMISLGAFATAVVAVFSSSLALQIIAFSVVSVVALFFVRPWARDHVNTASGKESNIYAMAGREAIALSDITETSGRVKIGGEVWSARAADDTVILSGMEVIVEKIDGAHAVVKEIQA